MPERALRVHLVAHHARDRAAGASGATLSLGDALTEAGCIVSYFFHDDAFDDAPRSEISRMIQFPWRVSRHLERTAAQFDVIDGATGDAWVWAWRGRPGGRLSALVTRTHGLEHVADAALRARARAGEISLSRKYPLYHGGLHLWEVRQSLVRADAQILPHQLDRDFATQTLGVSLEYAFIVPNGVADRLLDQPYAEPVPISPAIELAFIGSWIPRKGIRAIVQMTSALRALGVPFNLRLLGTGLSVETVLSAFDDSVRASVHVVPRYEPAHLPALLAGAHALVYASWTEGFSLALMEGMASSLAPVATRTGPVTTLLRDGENGLLIDGDSGETLATAVARLAADPRLLARIRRGAHTTVQAYRWAAVAQQTIAVYRAAISRRTSNTTAKGVS